MPIKSQKKNKGRGVQKKKWNVRTILIVSVIALCIIFVLLYMIFGRSLTSEQKVAAGRLQDQQNEGEPIGESLPPEYRVAFNKAKLQLESVDNKDIVRVLIEKATGTGGGNITHTYEWTLNGQPAGDGSGSMSGFKRNDTIAVKITPFIDDKSGQPRVLSMEIANTTPKILEQKEIPFDGTTFTTQIKATDPDGDPLTYELLSGPQGMTIEGKSGIINWPVKDNDAGDHTVKVKISDGHGGEVIYQLTATIPKDIPQPATVPKKSP